MTEMEGEKAMEMFKLVKASGLLPARVEELLPMQFIGTKALKYARDILNDPNVDLYMTQEQQKIALRDGQDAGEWLLDIEEKIGALLPSAEEAMAHGKIKDGRTRKDGRKILPEGITHRKARQARAIHNNPAIVAKIKAQARENEDIPTKTAVLNAISYEKEKVRQAAAATGKEANRKSYPEDQLIYINALDQCIRVLPQKPPKDWNENAFREATAKAIIIKKRLEVFGCKQSKSITE